MFTSINEVFGLLSLPIAKIFVTPNVQPRFFKPQPVPYLLKGIEIERLQQAGIIKPVMFSDWAAPVVPVVKRMEVIDFVVTTKCQLTRYPKPMFTLYLELKICSLLYRVENSLPS